MLEVVELKKIYKSKKGTDVHALDGVTLSFPETGMVFLLGKSGSGKSTLLNVCGGLDNPTSGEIIVKGRSSKKFSQSDFDSYRNTYIGFIFQEYNILNEFTVEDNIALALELQGKPKDKKAIQKLLEDVDLFGLAKRKPNTLSGGQKQRIAIARALIKSPQIIMADEPTGALDSNTGRQVFDTLKKLSKDKLVIVVSHDREFAEFYGDRIIELKDGKVISDVSKTTHITEKITENINNLGGVLCVKSGSDLSDSEFDKIKNFLKNSKNDVIIAANENDIKSFKKANHITDDGAREIFTETDNDKLPKRQYKTEESRFIRSKLPARHAIKIGVSGLKIKPIRLFFTILLCTVAFGLFGMLSTMTFYDSELTFKESLRNSGRTVMLVEKVYKSQYSEYQNGELVYENEAVNSTALGDSDLEKLRNQYGDDVFGALDVNMNFAVDNQKSQYYQNIISRIAYLPEENRFRNLIQGEYPKNDGEIVISSYTAEVMKECGISTAQGDSITINKVNDIIGKRVFIGNKEFKVTGVFDSGALESRFDSLKETEGNFLSNIDFSGSLSDGLHLTAFVHESEIKNFANEELYIDYMTLDAELSFGSTDFENAFYMQMASANNASGYPKKYFVASQSENLSDEYALITKNLFFDGLSNYLFEKRDEADKNNDYALSEKYNEAVNICYELREGGKYIYLEGDGKDTFVPFTDSEMESKLSKILEVIERENINLEFNVRFFDTYTGELSSQTNNFKVAGYIDISNYSMVFVSDNAFNDIWEENRKNSYYYYESNTKYTSDENAIYSVAYLPFNGSEEEIDKYWQVYSNKQYGNDDSRLKLSGMFVNKHETIDEFVETGSKIFLYVGLAFAVFAILLFSNFISVSISQKKREIGILRAVGARSFDVFKIFFSESFVIAAICVLLSAVGVSIACDYVNGLLTQGLGVSLLVFGIFPVAVLVGIALLTAIIATFLPVNNAARKKPVDSIRAL